MTQQELDAEPRKAIFTVILNNGERVSHTYDIPSDDKKINEFADRMTEMISNSMKKQKNWLCWFENPLICYNIDNVLGIQTDTLESEELNEIIKKSYRKAGFVKD